MSFPGDILDRAEAVIELCRARGWRLGAAESCTGGLVMGALTAISGSSDAVIGGFVTYSNEAKVSLLGVDAAALAAEGAVSAVVARKMARGALERGGLDIAVAVTGVAGPTGGTDDKPVGLVHFGVAWRNGGKTRVHLAEERFGDLGREGVREESVRRALDLLIGALEGRLEGAAV